MRSIMIALMTVVAVFVVASANPALAQPKLEKLMNPAQLNETAPDTFQVKFDTSKGEFIVEVTRAWAPKGADRFYNLVKNGFYDNCKFFRVIDGFMVQFGINGNPKISAVLRAAPIKDDTVKQSNTRGYVTFAMAGPNTRTTQLFVNFGNNATLDGQNFPPFGKVVEGMKVVDSIYSKYGEGAPRGAGPDQGRVQMEGNAYLEKSFPNLDYIKTASIVQKEAK